MRFTQARHWARERGISDRDLILASAGPHKVRGFRDRMVFVEAQDFYPGRTDYDTWRVVAELGRQSNAANGFETEIIHV
jgi:hypothetical protein